MDCRESKLYIFDVHIFILLTLVRHNSRPIVGETKDLHSVYFWASFLFLMSRTAAVIVFLSNVHVASKKGLPALFACPSHSFCQDSERLLHHMASDELALSGLGLFHVTRSFLLAVNNYSISYKIKTLFFYFQRSLVQLQLTRLCFCSLM